MDGSSSSSSSPNSNSNSNAPRYGFRDTDDRRTRRDLAQQNLDICTQTCSEIEANYAKRPDLNTLKAHFTDLAIHEKTYLERYEKEGASAHKGKVTEAEGEKQAALYMLTNHPEFQLVSGFAPGTGIDQVWVHQDDSGNLTIALVEAKGRGAILSDQADKGPQMSLQWVCNSVESWRKASTKADAADLPLVKNIIKGLVGDKNIRVVGMVIAIDGKTNKVGQQPLKNDDVYFGGDYSGKASGKGK